MPTPEEMREFERQLALKRQKAAQQGKKSAAPTGGVLGQAEEIVDDGVKSAKAVYSTAQRFGNWGRAACEVAANKAAKVWGWLDPVAGRVLRFGAWSAPKLVSLAGEAAVRMTCKEGEDGHRHFNPLFFAMNVAKVGVVATVTPFLATAAYYYGTWDTHKDVYIPNAGVFVNQQFVHPSKPGQIVAARDEVFTILGKEITPQGEVEPVRFDLDSNMFFFFYRDSLRPDLAASKADSQSPYGVKCTLETTGFYNRLPRYVRVWAVKWWDLRAEVVHVVGCEELKEVPAAFHQEVNKQGFLQQPQLPAGAWGAKGYNNVRVGLGAASELRIQG